MNIRDILDNATPRPWQAEKSQYRGSIIRPQSDNKGLNYMTIATFTTKSLGNEVNTANAALTVRAVNSFEVALEALEAALDDDPETHFSLRELEQFIPAEQRGPRAVLHDHIVRMEKALALMQGES